MAFSSFLPGKSPSLVALAAAQIPPRSFFPQDATAGFWAGQRRFYGLVLAFKAPAAPKSGRVPVHTSKTRQTLQGPGLRGGPLFSRGHQRIPRGQVEEPERKEASAGVHGQPLKLNAFQAELEKAPGAGDSHASAQYGFNCDLAGEHGTLAGLGEQGSHHLPAYMPWCGSAAAGYSSPAGARMRACSAIPALATRLAFQAGTPIPEPLPASSKLRCSDQSVRARAHRYQGKQLVYVAMLRLSPRRRLGTEDGITPKSPTRIALFLHRRCGWDRQLGLVGCCLLGH